MNETPAPAPRAGDSLEYEPRTPHPRYGAARGFAWAALTAAAFNAIFLAAWRLGAIGDGDGETIMGIINLPAFPFGLCVGMARLRMPEDPRPPLLTTYQAMATVAVIGTVLWGAIGAAAGALLRRRVQRALSRTG